MRMPSSVFAVGRYVLALTVVAGSVLLMSASKEHQFTARDKAFYADPSTVAFVRPGLIMKVQSAEIAADGTIKTRIRITDPRDLPLDRLGIDTPGAVSVSFIAAYIPKGQTQFVSYTTRQQTSPITRVTATQASGDQQPNTPVKVADGVYEYTFRAKAVGPGNTAFDRTATHAIGIYGSRNLSEFDLGTNYADDVYHFVPDGSRVSVTRDVIKTSSCNKCHDDLAAHGGSRRKMEVCVLCHTPQTSDPDTGNTVDMVTMTHKIHMGEELPSVQGGKKYEIIGNAQAVHDYSEVVFPAGISRCEFCHEQNTNAAQKDAFLHPTRSSCGSCHDNVNFASGQNHANLAQVSDNQCSTCHIPQGELEYDVSIKGAHVVEAASSQNPGYIVNLTKVENGSAGRRPTITFTMKDAKGRGMTLADLPTTARNRLAATMAGPTTDYGYTSFGSDVTTPGYVTEDLISAAVPANAAKCASDGTCTYTFLHAIPADAKGTYTIGMEGRRDIAINPGTTKQVFAEFTMTGKVAMDFSVDGSPVAPRRKIVDMAKCNNCHGALTLHGANRSHMEQCVLCHNPSQTDSARRPIATVTGERSKPAQAVNMALMIHKIHTGEQLHEYGTDYTVIGNGGSFNPFDHVRYPALGNNGAPGATFKCDMCHVGGSETRLPIGKNQVRDPQGRLALAPAATSACLSCHLNQTALAHAQAQTDDKFGESCDVCHTATAIGKAHAR